VIVLVGLVLAVVSACSAADSTGSETTRWADPAAMTAQPIVTAEPTSSVANARPDPTVAPVATASAAGAAPVASARSGLSDPATSSLAAARPTPPSDTAAPSAHLQGNEDLGSMIPDRVHGHVLTKSQFGGAELAASGGIADGIKAVLAAVGKEAGDLSVAMGQNSAADGSQVSVLALRIRGVAATTVKQHWLELVIGHGSDMAFQDRTIAGKTATCFNTVGSPTWSCAVPRDDVMFVATSDEFLLVREAIAAIP
jgi:hypothetical protein